MKTRSKGCRIALELVGAALIAACGSGQSAPAPPPIAYGVDVCSYCRMAVDDPRFAAAAIATTGETLRFDDIGCLLRAATPEPARETAAWVHDYHSGDWLKATTAWIVRAREVVTPMASGLVAFASSTAATEFAMQRSGEILKWDSRAATLRPVVPTEEYR